MARTSLTRKRLVGLDRSGPPPPETLSGAPLNPWTLPNAIGYIRLALIPVFLVIALSSGDGRSGTALAIYIVIAATDYLDGIVARVTGQYSRLGTLLDPLVDRLLVISGAVVTFRFDLLPRWALLVLAARELLMLVLSRVAMRHGLELKVNMVGRWAVWPVMVSLGLAMGNSSWVPDALLYVGLAMTLWATALYFRDAREAMNEKPQA
ncbi:MAG TPA: CDP-alcohol phosphatidyltransferase family protein [Thermoleophilaceae bacterium]|nr:CDP-alcohol phosphatidyltransferase family protein [Thermoleophilaceae bacterium]